MSHSLARLSRKPLEIGGVGRKEAAKNDRLSRLEPGQRFCRRPPVFGDHVANPAIDDSLDVCGDEPDLARRPKRVDRRGLRSEDTDPLDQVHGPGRHQPNFLPRFEDAVLDWDQGDDPGVGVIPAVDQKRLARRVRLTLRRRQPRCYPPLRPARRRELHQTQRASPRGGIRINPTCSGRGVEP